MARFRRTLIVEQNNDYIRQVKEMLAEESDSFLATTDGEEALKLYDSFQPDLVLAEAILPGYDGFALMEHILPDKHVTKIVLAAANQELIVKKAFELEAGYVIVKPYVKKYFIRRVLEAAKMQEGRRQAFAESDQLLDSRISVALKRLGIPMSIKGYKLLREALMAVCTNSAKMRPLNRNVYMPLAQKYGSTVKCVERNIRHAIETAATRGDTDAFYEYFGYSSARKRESPQTQNLLPRLPKR